MTSARSGGLLLALVLVAGALRFPDLARRPMHADEAIHAEKAGALLEGRGYAYDPSDYHGPTLYYLTLIPAWIRGQRRYVDLDEVTLRCVPAALGVVLVAAQMGARASLGLPAALVAGLLAALSPAMVFYSRYFIHETPLVFFTFGVLLGAGRYGRRPSALAALLTGGCAGLMLATKETAPLALGSLFLAITITALVDRWTGKGSWPDWGTAQGRHATLAVMAAVVVSSILLSSFFANPGGLAEALQAYGSYLERARAASVHVHPWHYYLGLLVHFSARGTPFWTEGLILALAVVGGLSGWVGTGPAGGDTRVVRVLAFYTLLIFVSYSAIPYKTPWCLLSFLQGMILLAGVGAVVLVRLFHRRTTRAAVIALLVAGAAHLGLQAFESSFQFDADPRNPYVYAQTGPDVFTIVDRVRQVARIRPDGASVPIDVISRANLWPLPWYLRRLPNVAWWNGVSEEAKVAPLVLLTPDMEPALIRRLYDVPPPGQREVYVSLFDRPVELRPGVELRGYLASGLWDDVRRPDRDGQEPTGSAR